MVDRAPTKPNRYAVYDDAHNFIRYEYHERADEPTQAGDALNKANLLPDAVATALGLTGNAQVKDALIELNNLASSKAKVVTGSYTGTGTYGGESPNSLAIPEGAKIFMFLTPWFHPAAYPLQWAFSPNSINNQVLCGTPINLASIPSDYVSIIDGGTKIKKSGNSLYWYNTSNASAQCNEAEVDYHYAFIG